MMQTSVRCSAARPFTAIHPGTRPPRCIRVRASDNPFDGPGTSSQAPAAKPEVSDAEKEMAIEALERRSRQQVQKARRQIPIRGQTTQQPKDDGTSGPYAPWPEGQLLPTGWDQMSLPQKVTELYMGRRGVLFWANKAAYASVFILIGGWIIFRFVGPNLGLYNLQGDVQPPPF